MFTVTAATMPKHGAGQTAAVSSPAVVAPPVALVVLGAHGHSAVFLIGVFCCRVGALLAIRLAPCGRRGGRAAGRHVGDAKRGPVLLGWLSFVSVTVTHGTAVSFTPFLLGRSLSNPA